MRPPAVFGGGMNTSMPNPKPTQAGPATVVVPYVNVAMHSTAQPFSQTTCFDMKPALTLRSKPMMTSGNEPALPPIKGPGMFTGVPPVTVSVDMAPAVCLGDLAQGDNSLAPLGAVTLSPVLSVQLDYVPPRRPGEGSSVDDLDELADAVGAAAPGPVASLVEGSVGYVHVPVFGRDLPALFLAAVSPLLAAGARTLILDLRGNPGGDLDAALRLADDFLELGQIVARLTDGDGDETVRRARGRDRYLLPVVLLVDGDTASAAEVLAGALQHHRRALVLGQRTYGKGVAERVLAGRGGESVRRAPSASLAFPDGAPVHGRGVVPDIELSTAALGEPGLLTAAALRGALAAPPLAPAGAAT